MENSFALQGDRISLSDKDFQRLSTFIESTSGIQMPMSKKSMLTARIQKRLRLLGMASFTDYVDLVLDPHDPSQELIHFLDIVTTNKTDFFREPNHFSFMTETALPNLMQESGAGTSRPLRIWSAPCSTGEEPYTMAIVIKEFATRVPGYKAAILGTDLSTRALHHAENAIYEMEKADPVPLPLKQKYMLRSKDRSRVRMAPEIREMVRFQHLNFMDGEYRISQQPMDIIFCRNCLIYFDRPTAEKIVNKLCRHLLPGGYFFIGHSETLNKLNVPVMPVAPTIYQLQK
ncbi:MAG: chemotaxis protein CheR [Magnetococcales bacterium]|nr:chemotaxis protein CheR [Magnetococcales bacterium]MBF0114630.1 chemotaxis protein CheR [Magnetococcales bacterium]